MRASPLHSKTTHTRRHRPHRLIRSHAEAEARDLAAPSPFAAGHVAVPARQRNLQRLQESLLPSTALATATVTTMSRTWSPARSKNNLDARNKLEAYRIKIDRTDGVFPLALAHHLDTVVGRLRDARAAVSPNGKQLVKMRRHAAT